MIGRQVIPTKRAFTLAQLDEFMRQSWDQNEYNSFLIGKPTPASIENYILLPATARFMVIVYPRRGGGLFRKEDRVILSVCDSPDSIKAKLIASIPSHNAFFGAWKISQTLSVEKERKGPAEEALQKYTAYLKRLLTEAGYAS